MRYYCRDCENDFDEMEAQYYIPSPELPGDVDYENAVVCPYCESLNIDEKYDEDEMYFGYDDFDEELEIYDDKKMAAVVDEYCGKAADKVVDFYWRMGELKMER